jgi:hypothetical protein
MAYLQSVSLWALAFALVIIGVIVWQKTRIERARILEKTYFKYRNAKIEDFDSSQTSRALAQRYDCEPLGIGEIAFPVTLMWQNNDRVIHPDEILRTLDPPPDGPSMRSPSLNRKEYIIARELVKSVLEAGPIQYEGYEYCMKSVDLSGTLPQIDGRIGYYYDHVLTQYAIAWELKKAIMKHGLRAPEAG